MKFITVLVLSLLSFSAFAISESNYSQTYFETIVPFYKSTADHHTFKAKDGLKIHYVKFLHASEKGAILIFPGQSEPALKFAETIYDLYQAGYTIYAIDHRGQGLSDRMLSDPQKSYVKNFQDYVSDAEIFLDEVASFGHTKKFLLTHSMGGTIATLALEKNPNYFNAAVLTAPMYGVQTKPYPEFLASFVASILKPNDYAPDRGPYRADASFVKNILTNSEPRFLATHKLLGMYPENMVGGPTVQWVRTTLKTMKKFKKMPRDFFKMPVIILQAGQEDWVKNSSQNKVCAKNSKCRVVHFEKAKHEILTEVDSIRDEVLRLITVQFE